MSTNIVCISHLRWNFVWQRPQHLLSRLAKSGRLVFVEEPVILRDSAEEARLEVEEKHHNVTVLRLAQPAFNERWIGHGDPETSYPYEKLLKQYLKREGFHDTVLWLYTPMALHFTRTIPHQLLVYDVMDELSAFKGAPAQLHEYEKLALERADLVFTGGASLYENKKGVNPQTHLFPSGVEVEHFAPAARRDNFEKPADIAHLKGKILGYYGVIDERMDLDLIAFLAEKHPEWDIVMIGPIAKISNEDLPAAPNIHFIGMKTYQELPAYLAHFDVALVPFAMNDSTRYLSPTKTLEYMAAHKPIVSTPIHDVIALYGSVVRIGHTPEAFTAHVEAALREDSAQRLDQEEQLLTRNTWDSIALRMNGLMVEQMRRLNIRKEVS